MRSVFGIVSIVVVLLIVALVAKQQLKAAAPHEAPPGVSLPAVGNDAAAAKNAVKQVQQQVDQALQQGAARASEAADGQR